MFFTRVKTEQQKSIFEARCLKSKSDNEQVFNLDRNSQRRLKCLTLRVVTRRLGKFKITSYKQSACYRQEGRYQNLTWKFNILNYANWQLFHSLCGVCARAKTALLYKKAPDLHPCTTYRNRLRRDHEPCETILSILWLVSTLPTNNFRAPKSQINRSFSSSVDGESNHRCWVWIFWATFDFSPLH